MELGFDGSSGGVDYSHPIDVSAERTDERTTGPITNGLGDC